MRRKHYRRYQGRFSRLASLARSLTTSAAARLLLVIAAPLVIMPMPAQAQGNAQSAVYRVTFEGKFTASALASGVSVPSGEHFTTLIGAIHNGSVTFWSSGGTASAGIESMAEVGGTTTLKSEINAASPNSLAVIEQSIVSGGTATATVEITLTTDHPLVTLTSMVAPSPDWFVGVSGLSLRNTADDGWQTSLAVNLFPYDAGTEDGTEFSLSNSPTSPRGTITSIKGTGKFSNEPIATLTFDLLTAPMITTTLPILVPENETAVATLTASDDDTPSDRLTWTIPSGTGGGADADHFTLSETGILAFSSAKDYETPDDADADRTYEVTVQVSDGDNPVTVDMLVTMQNVLELLSAVSGPSNGAYAENGALRVATYTASSPEDNGEVVWSLSGHDAAAFSIDNPGGVLRFLALPDYESPSDTGGDNGYAVTVTASDGGTTLTRDVSITVTDQDEAGVVTLSPVRPRVGTALNAAVTDPDGSTSGVAWTWECSTGPTAWAAIEGAASSSYTPTARDAGHYLRATANYADGHGTGKSARAVAPYTPLAHLLSALSVTGPARGPYPAFDPEVLHYAMECDVGEPITLTLSAAESSTRVAVNGVQRPGQNAVVELTGFDGSSDIPITLTGGLGGATTYVLHCFQEDFPDIATEKGSGATEELIAFSLHLLPPGFNDRYGYPMIVDNNGVPRVHRRVDARANHFRPQNSETYPFSYSVPQSNTEDVWVLVDRDLNELDRVTTVAPLRKTDRHDFIILDNGDYLLLSYEPATRDLSHLTFLDAMTSRFVAVQDSAIQIVTPARRANLTWNSWDHMAVQDCRRTSGPEWDYAHGNSLWMADGVIVASFRSCGKVLGIDAATGEVVWRLGRSYRSPEEWGRDELSGHGRGTGPAPMTILDDPYGEFCGQHSAQVLDNGHILLYDNGIPCVIDPAMGRSQRKNGVFSRAVEYAIDPDNGEAIFQRHHSLHGDFDRVGRSAGLVKPMDNGDWLVSWGRGQIDDDPDTALPPDESVTQVDPDNGTEKFSISVQMDHRGEESIQVRAYPLSPVALATEPAALEAMLVSRAEFHTGTADRPRVVVAFNRPVVDFNHTTPSLNVAGATVSSFSPHLVAGEAANAYLVTLTPAGTSDITVRLVADQSCVDGGICTADGTVLSEVPASHVIRADTTPPAVSNIEISSNPGSDRFYIPGDEIQATVNFSETVAVTGMPQLVLELGGSLRTATYQGGTGTAALVFGYEVADGESDTDGVGIEADSLSGGTIRDRAGHDAVLDHEALSSQANHKVDGVRPRLAATGGAVVDGTTLMLTYDEPLDRSSTPDAGDFTVSGGDQTRTVSRVSVSGSTVTLTLNVGAEHLEAGIEVSYTPGMNPLRDVPGNQAEALSRESVTNETPDTTPPEVSSLAITSNPGGDQIYAAADEIEVTVRFSETVEVEGTPQLRLRVGSRNRTAGYLRGTDTAALVFAYEVVDGDEDTDGVSIEAGTIDRNGGTITDDADNAADLAHEAVAPQAGHKVDGMRPVLVSTAVDGASLTLSYGEALDGGSRPVSGDFTVEVGGSGRIVTGVSVSGSVVRLTLNPGVEHGDTGIRVSYTVPTGVGANPIRDEVGNEARGLSSQSVTNTTGAPNTVPEITSPSSISVRENQAVVRRLAARDTDPGDEVTGWEIVGGADQSQFSIASDTGELSFREAPDFEAPGDNEYEVRVEVKSGAGARELEAEQTFTISVTDEREPPDVPEAPTFSGETAESLQVSWSEPDNTGPDITDYDVQYREKGTGRFSGALHEGPGRTLTLSDLNAGTVYEVQVRASNDEGMSDWSNPGEGMTVTPLTVVMASGTEPPVSGLFRVRFSFSEPVTGFSASDIETGQDPACVDDQNNTVFCDPGIGALQTIDDRVFTTTVTPRTDRVAHSYTLTMTVPGGAVRSSVGSKPNEAPEEPLEVRVAPPGAPEPVSSIDLRASSGSGSVRLSWNLPTDSGGSAIIRYEVRYQAVGEAWSEWENVGAGSRGVTVGGLVNGREYVFEVRAVNALGKGGAEAARATPERRIAPPPPPRGGGGGGGGGGLLFVPEAPLGLMAMPGEGAVRLEWGPPESDGGTPILRYEYRLKEGRGEFGEWTPIEDSTPGEVNASGYTVGGLGNGTVYVFELRAVNLVGNGRESEAVEAVMGLDPAYWSNFGAEDLQGVEASLERGPFGGGPQSLRLRFGADLRFEESELDGEGEVRGTRSGSYGYRYTSRTTGELRLDYDGGESCELRLTFRGEGAGSYSYRCGGALRGQGSFALTGLNRVPEISGAGLFEVAENQARVGQLEAVDGDDEIAGYGIAGGADGGLFAVVAETGELMFREAPDYEDPSDVESAEPASGAADNEYIVVVEVSSGEGERERKGSRAIRVRVSDEEEPPEITSLGPFEVVENQTRVGHLEAVDQDKQDEITEYGIAGGADGGLFAVVEETGELMFREAPDYETPGDVESADPQSGAGDNEYIVVVEVSSGEGERERRGRRAIRVRVADEEEPPAAPGAPVVTAEGSDSLKVSWREPENRGPEIVDYEVRYREGGEEGYSDGGHEGTGLEVRLSGLEEGTVYEVQVRAVNEEGISEWSEPGEGRTDMQDPDPDDPSDFTGEDLEGRRLTLRLEGEEGTAGSLELRFGEGNRFEQIESGGKQAATRSEGVTRSGSYTYEKTGPGRGTVRLDYDDGASCEIQMSFTETGVGGFAYDCGEGDPGEGSFRLTTGSLFVPVILSSAGQNQSFFTSELTLTNRGEQEVRLDYSYTAERGGGSGTASEVLAAGRQRVETDALTYLRGLGVPIPETGNRIGTLRVEARLGSEVEAVVRTTTLVPDGRAGLAYLGVAEEEGFSEAVYLCGLRQNDRDRSNVAFQNMGAPEAGEITLRTTVYSGEAADGTARVLDDIELEPGKFHQYSGLLGVLGVPAQGYVKVERVEGRAPFYAYGVINDQANSDGSFIFPVTAVHWREQRARPCRWWWRPASSEAS